VSAPVLACCGGHEAVTDTSRKPTCSARLARVLGVENGYPRPGFRTCGQVVALRAFVDWKGDEHLFCGLDGHEAIVRHQFRAVQPLPPRSLGLAQGHGEGGRSDMLGDVEPWKAAGLR
jgi:hypothetical protein